MYTLVRMITPRQLLIAQLPALAIALVIAELFYKLGSFTLECVAFLATWIVIDALFRGGGGRLASGGRRARWWCMAVTAGAFLLVAWIATKAFFVFL